MTLNLERVLNEPPPEAVQAYTWRDTVVYALGLGLGADPTSREELRFVYEKDLRALPTMAAVLANPGAWLGGPGYGVDMTKVVHGEQRLVLHRPLAPEGTLVGRARVLDVIDKGPGKGALIYNMREAFDQKSGEKVFTAFATIFARGDGGFGGEDRPAPAVPQVPDRAPDAVSDIATLPQAALIYRLSGDTNPLHADPDFAARAGFDRPILHGLCSYGIAGRAVLETYCGWDPARLKAIQVRFTRPVFPGETLRTEMWREGAEVRFRARVAERDTVVLDNGLAEVTG